MQIDATGLFKHLTNHIHIIVSTACALPTVLVQPERVLTTGNQAGDEAPISTFREPILIKASFECPQKHPSTAKQQTKTSR